MIISDYTAIYECNGGVRRELYLKAKSMSHATSSAQELIPASCTLKKVYHDPSWT